MVRPRRTGAPRRRPRGVPRFLSQDTSDTLIALAEMPLDASPADWPNDRLGGTGYIAAAILCDRLDALPETLTDPAVAWDALPDAFRALVKERNPAMAIICEGRWRRER